MKLTDSEIKAAKPTEKPYKLSMVVVWYCLFSRMAQNGGAFVTVLPAEKKVYLLVFIQALIRLAKPPGYLLEVRLWAASL